MEESQGSVERGKKRKKKRSSVQMAKKLARQRNFGGDLDSETYQYMLRILELLREGFPSAEEKAIFVNNVYEQTVGREVEFAKNQLGSRVLDSLLDCASLEVIQRLTEAFTSSLRPLSSDRFASHVLQKIIIVCADRGNRVEKIQEKSEEPVVIKESDVELYNSIALKLSRYFINNMEDFVWDTYANHVIRSAIECLGGLIDKPKEQNKKKVALSDVVRRTVIKDYTNLLLESCGRLLRWPRFLEFGYNELTSGLLQSILYSLKDVDSELTHTCIKKITEECFKPGEGETLSSVFDTESSSRLLEACLSTADPKSFSKICKNYFVGNLHRLCLMQGANFTVQRLLDHCDTKDDFETIFQEVCPHFKSILEKRHLGILTSVANACLRLQIQQGAFVNAILKMLECEEKQLYIVPCTTTLKSFKEVEKSRKNDEWKMDIELHGSLMTQAMLRFNKPIKIVNSILDMSSAELLHLLGNPKGSRVLDAFMESKFIGEKSREKLAKKLKGCWVQLAQSTHGSRCLERIWQWAPSNQRNIIMEELVTIGESLRSTKSGQILSSKLNVALFARSKKDWNESFGKQEKTRAMFANIIGSNASE